MNYEKYFLDNNGFIIEKNIIGSKKDFISKIGLKAEYYFEFFEYENLFYVIPFNKRIFNKSCFLKLVYDDNNLPFFESNIVSACSDIIDKRFFSIDNFIKSIIIIFNFIEEFEDYSDELLKLYPHGTNFDLLNRIELQLIVDLYYLLIKDGDLCFLNTHETLFKFFGYYDFCLDTGKNNYKNIGFAILAGIFRYFFDRVQNPVGIVSNYFGYYQGKKVNRLLGKPTKREIKYPSRFYGSVDQTLRKKLSNVVFETETYKLETTEKRIDNINYLKSNFLRLNFPISHHVLINRDEHLNYFEKYYVIDDMIYENVMNSKTIITDLEIVGFEHVSNIRNLKFKNLVIKGSKTIDPDFLNSNEHLETVVLPDTIKNIPSGFLTDCHKLKSIVLPKFLESIENEFLFRCDEIEEIEFPHTLRKIGSNFLNRCHKLIEIDLSKTKVEVIEKNFASTCKDLEEIFLPRELKVIGNAFAVTCHKILRIKLPENLKVIGRNFMDSCKILKYIQFPHGLREIGAVFLHSCKQIEEITLPNNLETIGYDFMRECSELKKINIPTSLKIIEGGFLVLCQKIKEIVIPDNIIEIEDDFMTDSQIENIVLSKNLRKIGINFMDRNYVIKKIFLPDSLESIGINFMTTYYRENLEEIYLSSSLKYIGHGFLSGRKSLKIYLKLDSENFDFNVLKFLTENLQKIDLLITKF